MAFTDLSLEEKIDYAVYTLFNNAMFYGQFIQGKVSKVPTKELSYTDGINIRFGEKADKLLNEKQFLFVLVHEVLHIMLGHCCKELNQEISNHSVANIVQDIVINSILKYNKENYGLEKYNYEIPKFVYNPPIDFTNTPWNILYNQYMEQIKDAKPFEEVSVTLENEKGETWTLNKTIILPEGYKIEGTDGEWYYNENCGLGTDETKLEMEMVRAKNISEHYGDDAGRLYELIGKIFENKIDWKIIFRNAINKIINSSMTSYMSPKRNLLYSNIILPGKRKQKIRNCGDVNVFIDTSGSMSRKTLMEILGELEFITNKYKKEGRVYFWDTEIYEPITLKEVSRKEHIEVKGRGGTCVECVINTINENKETDLNIIATDGYFNTKIDLKKNEEIVWLIYDRPNRDFSVIGKGKHTIVYID